MGPGGTAAGRGAAPFAPRGSVARCQRLGMQMGSVWTSQVPCCYHAPCLGEPSQQAGRRHQHRRGLAVLRTAAAVESKIERGAAWLPARAGLLLGSQEGKKKKKSIFLKQATEQLYLFCPPQPCTPPGKNPQPPQVLACSQQLQPPASSARAPVGLGREGGQLVAPGTFTRQFLHLSLSPPGLGLLALWDPI